MNERAWEQGFLEDEEEDEALARAIAASLADDNPRAPTRPPPVPALAPSRAAPTGALRSHHVGQKLAQFRDAAL